MLHMCKRFTITFKDFLKEKLIPGGLSEGKTLDDIAKMHKVPIEALKKQLRKGIKVEMEHTTNRNIANEIAMDHLVEDPFYYEKLETIESK